MTVTKKQLEAQNEALRKENERLHSQIDARVEESGAYQALKAQIANEISKKETYKRQAENWKNQYFELQAKYSDLSKQAELDTSQTAQNAIKSNLEAAQALKQEATHEAQSVTESAPEAAQNGTQGGTEASVESLPENIPLGKWQQEMVEKLRKIYDDQNQNLKEKAAVKIVRIWCATQKAEEALGMLYDYILLHLPQESDEQDEQDEPDTISGFARGKIGALQEKIKELEAKIDSTKTTEQYNFTARNYRLVDEQAKKIKELKGQLDTSVTAQDALKSNLEAVQAELQALKQESAKSQKNPFGAGRKPKLTADQVQEIQRLRAEGLTVRKIADKIDCSAALVCKLLKNDYK